MLLLSQIDYMYGSIVSVLCLLFHSPKRALAGRTWAIVSQTYERDLSGQERKHGRKVLTL